MKKKFKILKNYTNKNEFLSISRKGLFDSLREICDENLALKIKANGYNKIHHYFPADYIPFLTFLLKKKTTQSIYKFIANTGKKDLRINKFFYIDKIINYRVHYPFKVAKKSRLSRSVYKSINLNNFKKPEFEIKNSLKNLSEYKLDDNDKSKINYFGKLPEPSIGHSPHRDTWFGHSFGGINLWWGVAGVTKKTGLLLYPKVNNYELKHTINPSYVEDGYKLGKITTIGLNDGDLLVFDPEILHGTKLNNSDNTRIVFSGRLNLEKPKFYKKTMATEYPHWLRSDDVLADNFNKTLTFYRKFNFAIPKKEKLLKKEILPKIKINKKIVPNKQFKFHNSINIKNQKLFKLIFKNIELTVIKKKNKFFAFNSLCPHLKYDLSYGYVENLSITCPGHALKFDFSKGLSECKLFSLKKYDIKLKKDLFYLTT